MESRECFVLGAYSLIPEQFLFAIFPLAPWTSLLHYYALILIYKARYVHLQQALRHSPNRSKVPISFSEVIWGSATNNSSRVGSK